MPPAPMVAIDLEGLWWSLPLALAALLAIPYTIRTRRKRRRLRRAQMIDLGPEPSGPDEPPPMRVNRPSDDPYLWVRLVVAFAICAALAWLCYRVLPPFGVDVPWWVPVLCFAVILVTMLVRRAGEEPPEGGDTEPHDGVIGRIGPDDHGPGRAPP